MDRLIYTAMTGARAALEKQAVVANNLANVSTTGFRAQAAEYRAAQVQGDGAPTRFQTVNTTFGADFRPGAIQHTGRDLDVAVQGRGWIALQLPGGGEAYTRNGSLQIGANGTLQTRGGVPVASDGGQIAIPQDTEVSISADGTVSGVPSSTQKSTVTPLGRIKLVDPGEAELVRGDDGLFRLRSGFQAPASESVRLAPESLESSNVSMVDTVVSMIALAREFDMHMKMLQNAENGSSQASQILNIRA